MFKMCNDLIEAYKGTYDEDYNLEMDDGSFKSFYDMSEEEFQKWVEWRIITHSPKERLEVYLNWNGILGYSNRIYDIAMGKMSTNA